MWDEGDIRVRLPESRHVPWPDSVQAEVLIRAAGEAQHYSLESVPPGLIWKADRVRLYWNESRVQDGRLLRMVGPVELVGDGMDEAFKAIEEGVGLEDVLGPPIDDDVGDDLEFSGFL